MNVHNLRAQFSQSVWSCFLSLRFFVPFFMMKTEFLRYCPEMKLPERSIKNCLSPIRECAKFCHRTIPIDRERRRNRPREKRISFFSRNFPINLRIYLCVLGEQNDAAAAERAHMQNVA